MTATIACPHQEPGERGCTACKPTDDPMQALAYGVMRVACEGEVTGRVYRDSDGDPGVVGGVRSFWAVEDEEASCRCDLTSEEWDEARSRLVQEAIGREFDDQGIDPDYESFMADDPERYRVRS